MSDYHEPVDQMSEENRNFVRALRSLIEEIDAVDWYQQRIAVSENAELKAILAHNRDEEMEHACMTLEWLRRNMPGWDEKLRTYLFSEGDITMLEKESEGEGTRGDLAIGSLRGTGRS